MRLHGLKRIREAAEKTQKQVSEETKVPIDTYRGWEQMKSSPRASGLNMLADYFGCTSDELFGRTDLPKGAIRAVADDTLMVEVPLYGSIAAGIAIEMIEVEEYVLIPQIKAAQFPGAFFLRVVGESMNRKLPNCSLALIDPTKKEIIDGRMYALCVNGFDATIKKVHPLYNGYELIPESYDPTYEVMLLNHNEATTPEVTIIGEVVWHIIPLDWEY